MAKGYKASITNTSKELTAKEKILLADTSDCRNIGELKEGESVTINPDYYAIVHIENEKAEQKEYDVIVIVDKNGDKFTTGSENFIDTFINIVEDMNGSNEEFGIKCYTKPSKNFKGKSFLTCSIV